MKTDTKKVKPQFRRYIAIVFFYGTKGVFFFAQGQNLLILSRYRDFEGSSHALTVLGVHYNNYLSSF